MASATLFAPGIMAAAPATPWAADLWDPEKPLLSWAKPIRVQPVLMYRVATPREQSSWKSWGDVQDARSAADEALRIAGELDALVKRAEFPMEILPVVQVDSEEAAANARAQDADVTIIYPGSGSGKMLLACVRDGRTIIFVRHQSGPVYYWYESLSTRYLKPVNAGADDDRRLSVEDVVVDDGDELLWRLRAMAGLHNFVGGKIVALGGPMGKYAPEAPDVARERYKFDIVDVGYDDLGKRIESCLNDPARMTLAEKWTDAYLSIPGTTVSTERPFIVNSFVLYGVFKDIMREHDTPLFTIKDCMGTIMPMSKTTACLTLSLLNDEGLVAFCESDFVIVPAGVLLRCISHKPIFMHNSTFPHKGIVTCAHCTGPRRMDGVHYDPVNIVTHFESDYGAAPKVEIPVGQEVSFIDPEYANARWVGMKGTVEANPFYSICRSQQEVKIQGDWKKLKNEVRDSHWMMVYGDYLKETGYAAAKLGITWDNISEEA